jgi:hypothetical protein
MVCGPLGPTVETMARRDATECVARMDGFRSDVLFVGACFAFRLGPKGRFATSCDQRNEETASILFIGFPELAVKQVELAKDQNTL